MKRFELHQLIREELEKQIPSDVKSLDKAQQTSSTVLSKAKNINTIQEFSGAFKNWFETLGFQPGKISKMAIKNEVDKVLITLGYK
jgi:hypothetical protein